MQIPAATHIHMLLPLLLLLGQPKHAQVLIILALLGYIMELWPHKAPLSIGQVIVGDVENPSGVTRTSSTAADGQGGRAMCM